MFHRWFHRALLLGLVALTTAAGPAPGAPPPVRHKTGIRPNVAPGQTLLAFGQQQLGESVTLDPSLHIVIYNPATTQPAGAFFPSCANFVWAGLLTVGAKTTADFGVVDPPNTPPGVPSQTDYVWGNLVGKYQPGLGVTAALALAKVQPGDVLQFRNAAGPTFSATQHTAIVVTNNGGGNFSVVQQNFNQQTFVTSGQIDLSQITQGTVWAYRPVSK